MRSIDLKATKAVQPVEYTFATKEQVSEKTQKMNPREVISEPHVLITNQVNPVICNPSENEEAAAVLVNVQPEDQVDRKLEEWVAEMRKKRAALDLPTVMQVAPNSRPGREIWSGSSRIGVICIGLQVNSGR